MTYLSPTFLVTRISFLLSFVVLVNSQISIAQQPPAAVVTAKVEQVELRESQTFVGTVFPARTSDIGSAIDGRVVEFDLKLGQRVKKDDALAKLLTTQVSIELKAAQAELAARQAELAEMQTARVEDIQKSEAQLAAKKSAYEYANAKLARVRKLVGTNSVTEDQIEETQSLAVQAYHMYIDAQQAVDIAKKGARDEVKAAGQANVAKQEQEVARLQDLLEKHTIKAPFDGYIAAENTEAGQWLKRGDLVVKLVDLDQVDVEIAVPEKHIPFLQLGQEANLEITALPEQRFIGKISEINPQGDVRTRNFSVRVRIEQNPLHQSQPVIKGGMYARATLPAGNAMRGLVVPKDAIVLGAGPSPIVFVVTNSPTAKTTGTIVRAVPVTLGSAFSGLFEIRGDLQPGELVVVKGNERLQPNAEVQVVK
jgi:HlyD family secretion protein